MKRLLLLFTALPLLVTACFNHTASLAVNKETIARELQSTGAPQFTQTNAPYSEVPENPTAGASNMKLKISLTGDVRLTREFDISSPESYAGGSYEIDNLPVGAEVDVDVSLWQGDTKEYGTEFPKSVRLETGTNEVTVELAQALQKTSINPTVDGQDLPEGQPIDIGAKVGFEYGIGNEGSERGVEIHLSVSPDGGTIAGNDTSSPTLTFSARGSYTIEVYATAAGYAPSERKTHTINVDMRQLEGTVTAGDTGGTITSVVGQPVSFQYNGSDVPNAVIHLSGLREEDVTVLKGGYTNGEITSSPGGQIELQFKNPRQYTVAAWATAAGYAPSEPAEYNINVNKPTLAGTITANPTSGSTLTRGQTVTFEYTGDNSVDASNVTIHLPFDDAAGITGGTRSGNEITGTSPVTLTFNPTSSEANPADKTYTITGAYASLDDYQDSTAAADFTYTVNFPTLSGNFTRTPETDIAAGDAVTFRHSDAGATLKLEITKTSGTLAAGDISATGGTLSNGTYTVTAAGSPANSVTLTFNTTGSYTVMPSATKANHKPQTGNAFTVTVNIKFVRINGDTVRTSIGENGGPFKNASAQNPVTVNAFRIAETELTYAKWYEVYQWATTQAPNRYTFANAGQKGGATTYTEANHTENEPVTMVSWRDAVVWCNAASEKDNLNPVYLKTDGTPVRDSNQSVETLVVSPNANANGYRLPTEAEWEFAARGGKPNDTTNWNYTYAGSNDINAVAWNEDNSGRATHDVKTKTANGAQLYDMSGNVREWCWDKWSASLSNRAYRGGSWIDSAITRSCTVADRGAPLPDARFDYLGFRVVRSGTGN